MCGRIVRMRARTSRHHDRRNRLDWRAAHRAGSPAGREPLDRNHWRHRQLSGAPQRGARSVPPRSGTARACADERPAQPGQRVGLTPLRRAARVAHGPRSAARAVHRVRSASGAVAHPCRRGRCHRRPHSGCSCARCKRPYDRLARAILRRRHRARRPAPALQCRARAGRRVAGDDGRTACSWRVSAGQPAELYDGVRHGTHGRRAACDRSPGRVRALARTNGIRRWHAMADSRL